MPQIPTVPTEVFLPYMRDVGACEQALHELGLMWRLIDASAKMNCPGEARTILAALAATRSSFGALERALVDTLVQEKVAHVQKAIGTRAQHVIDIIVRNLFERTADVGFLATDGELCAFVAGLQPDAAPVRARLQAYRDKYTVYDQIMLLDLHGRVLVGIDPSTPATCTDTDLLATTLACDGFVETFRATPLQPGKRRALIYSRRMHHPHTGAVVGVLCLCFNLEQEMAGIFDSHGEAGSNSVMLLLDASGQVIASSEPRWIAPGTTVPTSRREAATIAFCGRKYLVRTIGSGGYQGYPGPPGWQGQVMMPLDVAFDGVDAAAFDAADPALVAGLLSHVETFCPPLHDIMTSIASAAGTIERIVWNGHLLNAGRQGEMQKLKSILEQISETGNRSNELFATAIRDLFQTVSASSMREAESTAHLLVDLLDRNLYERSDDCRWWALTPQLRAALAAPECDAATLADINRILSTINGLYTVYTSLLLYDRHGTIIAGTGAANGAELLGSHIGAGCLESVLRLADEQCYHVSPFIETPLYDGRPTYLYHAALRSPDDPRKVVGGIGIVFDAEPELRNMLQAGLGGRRNMQAYYLDRTGRILSGTDGARAPGAMLALDQELLGLANGASLSKIVIHDGQYAIVACSASSGYREFKVTDGYRDDVLAVVFESFGAVRTADSVATRRRIALDVDHADAGGAEYATFYAGSNLLAIGAGTVRHAVPAEQMLPTALSGRPERIGLMALQHGAGNQAFIWVYDLVALMGAPKRTIPPTAQILLLEHGVHAVGLLVDDLHAVPQFGDDQIIQMPFRSLGTSVLVTQVIKANGGELLIQLIDPDRLFALLRETGMLMPTDEELQLRSAA